MNRPSAELLAEVFPDVRLTGEVGEFGTLLAIDRARKVLGFEAAVMAAARRYVPVPRVLLVMPPGAAGDGARAAMVLEHVAGTPLSQVLSGGEFSGAAVGELGGEVGRAVAGIGAVTFECRGFFADEHLTIRAERPWAQQLPEVAAACMAATPPARLDAATRRKYAEGCRWRCRLQLHYSKRTPC
jgi:hypothetical protein